jgi:hypothetical protein
VVIAGIGIIVGGSVVGGVVLTTFGLGVVTSYMWLHRHDSDQVLLLRRLSRMFMTPIRAVSHFAKWILGAVQNYWHRKQSERLGRATVLKNLVNGIDAEGVPLSPASTSGELGEVADSKTKRLTLAQRAQLLAAA